MSNMLVRRKPLNMIEQPQWPEIREGPPRFVKVKRTSKVDVGAIVMDADHYPELWGHAILTNSWNDNQTKYGTRPNHTLVVNKEFRPPVQDEEDIYPISRGKRPVVFGRINPGGGYVKAQNTSANQVDGWLKEDERVAEGSIAPTFESHVTFFEPSREPLLAKVMPDYSVNARDYHQTKDEINPPMHITLDAKMPPVVLSAGLEVPFGAGTPFEVADLKLKRNHPELSIDAGSNTLQVFTPRELPIYEYTLPRTEEITAGRGSMALTFPTFEYSLEQAGLSGGPISAGFESGYREYEMPIVPLIETPKLPAHQKGAGHKSTYSEPFEARKNYPEARRSMPSTGYYRIPDTAIGNKTPDDLGQARWKTRGKTGVSSGECNKATAGYGKMPARFVPTAPRFHPKSDAMRHHVWVPSQQPGNFSPDMATVGV